MWSQRHASSGGPVHSQVNHCSDAAIPKLKRQLWVCADFRCIRHVFIFLLTTINAVLLPPALAQSRVHIFFVQGGCAKTDQFLYV